MARGQFFIISTVVIISMIITVVQYLYDFGRIDLRVAEELREVDYIRYVRDSLTATVAAASCATLDAELNATEAFLAAQLAKAGILLTTVHHIHACPVVTAHFNLTAPNFFSQTTLQLP